MTDHEIEMTPKQPANHLFDINLKLILFKGLRHRCGRNSCDACGERRGGGGRC